MTKDLTGILALQPDCELTTGRHYGILVIRSGTLTFSCQPGSIGMNDFQVRIVLKNKNQKLYLGYFTRNFSSDLKIIFDVLYSTSLLSNPS